MTRYYSDEIKWRTLQARFGSFINYDLHYGAMTKIFEHIDETERYILQSEFWHLYTKVDKYYDASIATKILHSFESTEAVLEKNIHKKTLASIDSKGCDLATKALDLLNQVNSGKNVYESKHITVQEIKSGTRGMNDYGTTKSITRPMTADELMRLDYAPLNNVRDDFKARLEQLQEDPSLLGEELSVEQLQALQNMTIQDMMGYTGDFGEYIMLLSDRAQRWSFWEPFIDVTISIASIALAGATFGLSLGFAAAYFTAKAAWYISNDTNMLTGLPLTNGDKGWLIFDAVTSMFAAGAGLKLLQTGSKVPSTVMKAITATDKALNVVELCIAAGTGLYALQNQQYGTSIVMLGLVVFGAKGLKGSSDYDLGGANKGVSGYVDDISETVVKRNHIENGPYIKDGKPNGRPQLSGDKKLQFENEVYNNQVDPDGILRDPNTGEVIDWKPGMSRNDTVDFGHTEGNSYKKMFEKYKNGEITLEELKSFQFDPNNFRLETPSSNRSHKYE